MDQFPLFPFSELAGFVVKNHSTALELFAPIYV
jgi:hypothetical protein